MSLHALHEREADRQRSLLAAILAPRPVAAPSGLREAPTRAQRGLGAYRANAHASAARALGSAFGTVQAMLGTADFEALARAFLQQQPPLRGDLGEWGADLPDFIAAQATLTDWPYLADCARLDWAVHQCERAPDGEFDAGSLSRLGDTDPSLLHLQWMPGTLLLESDWPIALIHAAHQRDDDGGFEQVRQALQQPQAQAVLVARSKWRAAVHQVDESSVVWTRHLLAGGDLGHALAGADPRFDFSAWLAGAVALRWLTGITVEPDQA